MSSTLADEIKSNSTTNIDYTVIDQNKSKSTASVHTVTNKNNINFTSNVKAAVKENKTDFTLSTTPMSTLIVDVIKLAHGNRTNSAAISTLRLMATLSIPRRLSSKWRNISKPSQRRM